jgi:hypothetical protein
MDIAEKINEHPELIKHLPYIRWCFNGDNDCAKLVKHAWYHWIENGREDFHKYKFPCNSETYEYGTSWIEELQMPRVRMEEAFRKVGYKFGRSESSFQKIKIEDAIIQYYTNKKRLTFYTFIEDKMIDLIKQNK